MTPPPLVTVERPAAGEPEGLLVLHHGRGTDENDLIGLADVLDPEARLRAVSARAPLQVPGWPGYHWYLVPKVGYPDRASFDAARAALAEADQVLALKDGRPAFVGEPGRLGEAELRELYA